MKKATLAGALLAMLVICLSALTAVSASAAEWLCNGKAPATATTCSILSENLEVLLLTDMSAGSGVECAVGSVLDEGFVGTGAKDETTKVEFMESGTQCTAPAKVQNLEGVLVTNACKKVIAVAPDNLPWHTELITVTPAVQGKEQWDIIKGTGVQGGEPGYLVECEIAPGINVDDLCEAVVGHPAHVGIENLKADEEAPKLALVDALFTEETFEPNQNEWGKCTVGGANSALVKGEILFEAFEGGKAVSLEADK